MKIRVVIFNGINQFADMDLGLQLLADFPAERFLRTLTCLDLATGKFPAILKSSVATLRGKHLLAIQLYTFPSLNITAATTFIVFISLVLKVQHGSHLLKVLPVNLIKIVQFLAVDVKDGRYPASFPARHNNLAAALA